MNATEMLTQALQSVLREGNAPVRQSMAIGRQLKAKGQALAVKIAKLSRPMDEATAVYLRTQQIRHRKWRGCL